MEPDPSSPNGLAVPRDDGRSGVASVMDGYLGTVLALALALIAIWPHVRS